MFSSCRPVPLADIKLATKNFNESMIIGEGAEGNVYKGVFLDGQKEITAAVKRLKDPNGDIRDEINMLSRLSCSHVVSLLGHCQESGEKILIYEYMHNGNLFQKLYGRNRPFLSWEQRLKICIGAAKGLHYLHNSAFRAHRIIHRDVKTGNILLNENWEAKIADFGLSKKDEVNELQSEIVTKFNLGTPVYQPRELRNNLKLSRATDVFSFGVVLIEMLSRMVPFDDDEDEDDGNIVKWAQGCINKGKHGEMVDPELDGQISPNSLKLYLDLLGKCLREIPNTRPVMKEVVEALEFALKEQGPPPPPPPPPPRSATRVSRRSWGTVNADPKVTPQPSGFGVTSKYRLKGKEDRIVLFFTSLPVIKETYDDCNEVRSILKGYGVDVEERDLLHFKDESVEAFEGKKFPIPQLFIQGKYVGGAAEIKKAHAYGELEEFLSGLAVEDDDIIF